ncbi:hypothetical protein EWM62_01300 [Mucilaginibacter terrigena]|uniref:Uncharacterized protein n=1 Tax=Mucilaginibacter terrigena TaxID=2492395 RepID=A0A4Q5LRD9_9SPHI|nr:hypothetical protein [Mucilaginibacter terrigena]RYU92106.1 hypothetical protein EWM62_01300 [Mucilaginibacter terrigena]
MKDKAVINEAALLDQKADELVALLQHRVINARQAKAIQHKINKALDEASLPKTIGAFAELDTDRDRLDLLNDFELLLSQHQLDTDDSKKYLTHERVKKSVVVIIGIVMITLGMAMIIMPAPPYFEMFTVFYFNDNDGVTLMDLIALLIVFTGVYLFLSSLLKKRTA